VRNWSFEFVLHGFPTTGAFSFDTTVKKHH
jgi:hypothetical protein